MTDDFAGWTPVRVGLGPDGPLVQWCYTEGFRFDDPFFDQTVERCMRMPFRLLCTRWTSLDTLAEVVAARPGPMPSGFVFHLSRCGSTLTARMFGARGDTLVMAEPGPVDTVLRAAAPVERRASWLDAVVGGLGTAAQPTHRHYVVKFDSWALLEFDVVARAFPDVPWVFLHRDPVEVLVSQSGHRGYHMVPFALPSASIGRTHTEVAAMSPLEYGAAVLGRICASAVTAARAAGPRALFVDYAELPGAVPARIARHFGMSTDATRLGRMLTAATRDAKNPVLPYADDRAAKQRLATPELRAAVDLWAAAPYAEMRAVRSAG